MPPSLLQTACLLAIASACLAQENPKRDAVVGQLRAAILGVERIHDPKTALSVLEEAGAYLKIGCEPRCEEVFDSVYESIVRQDLGKSANRNRSGDSDLFRRFLHLVSKVDQQLAHQYLERFRQQRPEIKTADWETANDLFDDDFPESLTIASLAASMSSDFPDAALNYLRRISSRSQPEADNLARKVLNRLPDFPANSRLELLAYLFGDERVPELLDGSVTDKYIAGRLPSGANVPDAHLIGSFTQQVLFNPLADPQADLFVLALTEAHLAAADRAPQMIASLKHAEARDSESLTKEAAAKISSDAAKWMKGGDSLQQSAQDAENKFQTSKDEKFRYRATLLQAISLARQGKMSEALDLLPSLPVEGRDNARDAILLFVADAIKSPEQADELGARARTETRSEFVIGYAELAGARIRAKQPPDKEHDLFSVLNDVEAMTAQLKGTRRLVLQIGAANVWAQLDNESGLAALDRCLKDLNEDNHLDGVSAVTLLLSVPGMTVEYKVADVSLFVLVRTLAAKDIDSTLSHMANSNREDILLRGLVAACTEFLALDAARKETAVSPIKQ